MWTGIEGSSLRALDMVAIAGCPAVSSIVSCSSKALKRLKMSTFIGFAREISPMRKRSELAATGFPVSTILLAPITLQLFLT